MKGGVRERGDVLREVHTVLAELFALDPARIAPNARLCDYLEIDSIDAIDLVERLHRVTGLRVSPEKFRSVRTVSDLVDTVHPLVNQA